MTDMLTNLGNNVDQMFDPNQPGGYFGNPGFAGLLGVIQGLGATSGASRLPITNGQVFGSMAGGLLQGSRAGLQTREAEQQIAQQNLVNRMALARYNAMSKMYPQYFGSLVPPSSSSSGSSSSPSYSGNPSGTTTSDESTSDESTSSTPSSGMAGAGGVSPGANGRLYDSSSGRRIGPVPGTIAPTAAPAPRSAVAQNSSPNPDTSAPGSPLGIPDSIMKSAMLADFITPGAGKDIISKQFAGPTDFMRAYQDYASAPPQLKQLAGQRLIVAAGDRFQLMRNGWAFDKIARQWIHMPDLGEGVTGTMGPNGQLSATVVPGEIPSLSAVTRAKAGAEAEFKPLDVIDASGNEGVIPLSRLSAASSIPGSLAPPQASGRQASMVPPTSRDGNFTFGSVSSPNFGVTTAAPNIAGTQNADGAQPIATGAPATATAAPVAAPKTPVQFKGPAIPTKLGDFMAQLGPDYQVPEAPKAPAGGFLTKFSEARNKAIDEDTDRLAGYQREAAGGQKIYTNLQQLYQIIGRGLNTGPLSNAANDLAGLARQMGMSNLIVPGFDPNSSAAFNKLATDMVFGALKQLPGAPRVAEIEGLQKANPNLAMPPAANTELLNNALSEQRWKDARSRLATQWELHYPGTLGEFDAQFNEKYPQVDLYNAITDQAEKAGWKLPGDKGALDGAKAPQVDTTVPKDLPSGAKFVGTYQGKRVFETKPGDPSSRVVEQ